MARQQDLILLDASKLTEEQRTRLTAELRKIRAREFSPSELATRQSGLYAEMRNLQTPGMVKVDTTGLSPQQRDVLQKRLKDIVRGLAPGTSLATSSGVDQHLSHTDTDGWF